MKANWREAALNFWRQMDERGPAPRKLHRAKVFQWLMVTHFMLLACTRGCCVAAPHLCTLGAGVALLKTCPRGCALRGQRCWGRGVKRRRTDSAQQSGDWWRSVGIRTLSAFSVWGCAPVCVEGRAHRKAKCGATARRPVL